MGLRLKLGGGLITTALVMVAHTTSALSALDAYKLTAKNKAQVFETKGGALVSALLAATLSACGGSAEDINANPDRRGPPPNIKLYDQWDNPERFVARATFGNITADNMNTLLNKVAEVGHAWSANTNRTNDLYVYVRDANSNVYVCDVGQKAYGQFFKRAFTFNYSNFSKTGYGAQYPLLVGSEEPNFEYFSDGAMVYNAKTGQIVNIIYKDNMWLENYVGHLQYDIPAAVYEACPEFPSAQSLGMTVNTKQTSTTYSELLTQDSGRRVLRPELVGAPAYGPYDPSKPGRF